MPSFQPYWGKPAVRNDRGIEETSASFEARSAPRSYPTSIIRPPGSRKQNGVAPSLDVIEITHPAQGANMLSCIERVLSLEAANETASIHRASRRCGCGLAACR